MKLLLTDKATNKQIVVEVKAIKLIEPADAGGTHICFDAGLNRVVAESFQSICAAIGVSSVAAVQAP